MKIWMKDKDGVIQRRHINSKNMFKYVDTPAEELGEISK